MRLHLPVCQSTNDVLTGLLETGKNTINEGFIVSTDFQTAGRGQRSNRWESAPKENLMFSIVLYPRFLPARHAFWLSATVALAVAHALETYLPEVHVKWPNDLMVNSLKIGGILIENTVSGQNLERAIVGIGLNVNQTTLLPSATSLKMERHQDFDKEAVLIEVYSSLMLRYYQLRTQGWEKMRSAYYAKLYKMSTPHNYHLPDGKAFRATLKGVSENGELVLVAADGERRYQFKEVGFG